MRHAFRWNPSDPNALGDEIARTAAHLNAATHRLLTCIRAFDVLEEWARQGAMSCAHWLSWRIGLRPVTAREQVRVARALGTLPLLDEALGRGTLSYSQCRALTRVATPENERRFLDMALHCTGAQLERLCRGLRRAIEATEGGEQPDAHRAVREEVLENGMVRVTTVLHPDEAALLMKAIEQARRSPTDDGGSLASHASSETTRVLPKPDALVRVAETYLAHRDRTTPSAPRAQLVVHLDQDPLAPDGTLAATLDDGTRVSSEAFRRLSCDSSVIPVHHTPTGPQLNLGRLTRTITPPLRRALGLRDRGCRFPGCTHTMFLHAHHIRHWAHGGKTSLPNLINVCSHHHRLIHEGGFQAERSGDGDVVFKDPWGRVIAAAPIVEAVDGDGMAVVESWNEEDGTAIDGQTGYPGWDGERIDYSWAINAVFRG